ncbi:MAG: CPBP family intramembrane metalloprotease [Prosthecochloris sp.]|nr:CPBP family intramembrane metalloprotease [Prosthecochloris sp.]
MTRIKNSKARGISFWFPALVLLVLFVLYPLGGSMLLALVAPGSLDAGWGSLMVPDMLVPVRYVQVTGQVLFLLLPVFLLVRFYTQSRKLFSREDLEFLGLHRRPDLHDMVLAVLMVVLSQPMLYTLMEGIGAVLRNAGPVGLRLLEDQQRLEMFLSWLTAWNSPLEFFAVAIVIAVVPACCEELFFRGFVQGSYTRLLSRTKGILLTGLVFGLFHMSPVNLLPLVLMGWLLGYVYDRSGHIAVPVALHFTNNMISLFLLEFMRTRPSASAEAEASLLQFPLWWGACAVSVVLFWQVLLRFERRAAGRSSCPAACFQER